MFVLLTICVIFTVSMSFINLIEVYEIRVVLAIFFGIILFTTDFILIDKIKMQNSKNKEYEVILLKNNIAKITTDGSIVLK